MGCVPGTRKNETETPAEPATPNCPQEAELHPQRDTRTVLGRYAMGISDEDILGQGTFSVCRRGTDLTTGKAVAIKAYLGLSSEAEEQKVGLKMFSRQIAVLQQLQTPFEQPRDPRLWCQRLAQAKPAQLFMQLLDYSKDESGNPGPDPADGELYVVTELAQYSLADFLSLRRMQKMPLSGAEVRDIARAILLVSAALHAKGLAHLDLKPDNLMFFGGMLKLIDVDGCVPLGTELSIHDSSISYSRLYCAPEWASFLIDSRQGHLVVDWRLDAWSVGMTIGELVTLTPLLQEEYAQMLRAHSRGKATFRFLRWLSRLGRVELPDFDEGLASLLLECLLAPVPGDRRSLAQCLSHSYCN